MSVCSANLGVLPEINQRIGDKYVVESLIGRGGMGAVYRARHVLTGRRVALKWITSTNLGAQLEGRILREAQAMGRIEHPNVCAILDVGEEKGSMFLVMEHLEGMSLGDWSEGRTLSPAEIVRVLFGAMAGVSAAHREGVLHRDLKLDNIFVCIDKGGAFVTTKVLDFGISKLSNPQSHEVGMLTRTGQVMGTPHYMAPEQMFDDPSVDERVDVYSLGVILYELLSGRLPYEVENHNRLVAEVAAGPGTPLQTYCPNHDPALIEVVEKAIAHDRSLRFESVDAFALALEPFAEGEQFIAPSGPLPLRRSRASQAPTLTADELSAALLLQDAPRARSTEPEPLASEPIASDPDRIQPEAMEEPALPPAMRKTPWAVSIVLVLSVGLTALWWAGRGGPNMAPAAIGAARADAPALPHAIADAGPDAVTVLPDAMESPPEPAIAREEPVASPTSTPRSRSRLVPTVTPEPSEDETAPTVVPPPQRPITGRSGVLDPDDF